MRTWKKRLLSGLLALGLAVTLIPAAMAVEDGAENPSGRFSDVKPDNWAYEYIEEMAERGAINGYPDGTFKPKNLVTRVEFTKILVVAGGLTVSQGAKSSFADVRDGNWGVPYIEVSKPYMTYYKNGDQLLFKPKEAAVREDIAVAVVKLKGYDTRTADVSMLESMFSDVDTISQAAKPYVALAVEHKLISGYTDGTFRGQKTINRAETAAILWRAFQYGSDDKVVDPNEMQEPGESQQPSAPVESEKPEQPSAPVETDKPGETKGLDLIDKCGHGYPVRCSVVRSQDNKKIKLGSDVVDHWIKYSATYQDHWIVFDLSGEYDTLTLKACGDYDTVVKIYNNDSREKVLGSFEVKANAEPESHTIAIDGAVKLRIESFPDRTAAQKPTLDNYLYLYDAYLE